MRFSPAAALLLAALLALPRPLAAEETRIALDPLHVNRFPEVSFFSSVTLANLTVKGLTERDFVLTEDARPITEFKVRVDAEPVNVALVIDVSGSIKEFARTIKEGAAAFVAALKDSDQALIVRFSSDVTLCQKLTGNKDALANAISGLSAIGGTKLYDGIHRGLTELEGGHACLVLFTDGRDERLPGDATPYSAHTLDEVIALARQKNVAIFVIGTGKDVDEHLLGRLAKETGGAFFLTLDVSKIGKTYADISALLNYRYHFQYVSPNVARDGKWREVKLARKDGTAAATEKYRVDPEKPIADEPPVKGDDGPDRAAGGSVSTKVGTSTRYEIVPGADGVEATTVKGPEGFTVKGPEGFYLTNPDGTKTWVPGVSDTVVPAVPDTVTPVVPGAPDVAIPVPGDVNVDTTVDLPVPAPTDDAPPVETPDPPEASDPGEGGGGDVD